MIAEPRSDPSRARRPWPPVWCSAPSSPAGPSWPSNRVRTPSTAGASPSSPASLQSAFLRALTDLGLAPVTAGVALVAGASIWRRDRRRALACLAGPGLAVGLAELLKIMVGRRFEHALCWPSGTTAAVTAVVTVVVLVTRGAGRAAAVVIGSAVVILEAVALVAFRWHYLSDVLGGVVLGVGSVLLVDALFHRLRRPARREPWPPDPASRLITGPRPEPPERTGSSGTTGDTASSDRAAAGHRP